MKRFLYLICGFLAFNEGMSMGKVVLNPVNEIVRQCSVVTPEITVVSFRTSTTELIKRLNEAEKQYSRHIMLNSKWKHGIEVLNAVAAFDPSASSTDRERVYTLVYDITDNGFFDVSNTAITIEPTLYGLRPLFNDFWQHLLQAKEITTWWLCSAAKVTVEEVPYLCFEASGLLKDPNARKIFWSMSILGDASPAIEELSEDDEASGSQILRAKESAKRILNDTLEEVPSLRSSLEDFIK